MDLIQRFTSDSCDEIPVSDMEIPQSTQIKNYKQNTVPNVLFELQLIELGEASNDNTSDNDQGMEHMCDENKAGPSTTTTSEVKIKNVRKMNQLKRNSGQLYKSRTGKMVEPRKIKPLEKCRNNCRLKLSLKDQTQIFNSYWQNASYQHRFNYVASQISLQVIKRVRLRKLERCRKYTVLYHLTSEGRQINVCKKCFTSTLGETEAFCKNVAEKCWFEMNESLICDQRGKRQPKNKSSPEKLEEISNHIAKYPVSESHYSCSHTTKYLPSGLNVKKMHQMYSAEVVAPLSLKMYRQVFSKTGLKFKKLHSDTCSECYDIDVQM